MLSGEAGSQGRGLKHKSRAPEGTGLVSRYAISAPARSAHCGPCALTCCRHYAARTALRDCGHTAIRCCVQLS